VKAGVFSVEGKKMKEIELPSAFSESVKEELIKRAVLAIQSAKAQTRGSNPRAGRNYAATYSAARGKPSVYRIMNTGHARLPKLKDKRFLISGKTAIVPQAVHGPKAHPPKTQKNIEEGINKKEKKAAVRSAIAATADRELVLERHKIGEETQLPVIVEKSFEELAKTIDVRKALENLGLWNDVENAKSKRKQRAGKGKKRGRKSKKKKSILIVAGNSEKIFLAARNLEGVEICSAKDINAELLAPGAVPGRLTLWTETALEQIK
jgi:large subunit ribosomal protein L4e